MMSTLSNPLLLGLGLTVLHALWEIAALALLAQAGLLLLCRRSARIQCAWAGACLLFMGLAFAVTALLHLCAPGPLLGSAPLASEALPVLTLRLPFGSPTPGFQLQKVAPWLALGWLLGSLIMGFRLGGAMLRVDRVLRRGALAAPAALQGRLNELGLRIGLRRPVQLLLREGLSTPVAFGWLKPVILLPAAALVQVPSVALEAVLAHELAHLVRRDYLTNLVQSFIESLLFFHPAAWWLSGRVRELREHACDDLAVRLTGDPLPLAEGLHAFERLRRTLKPVPNPALAAVKGPVMSRINRLLLPSIPPVPSWRIPLALLIAGSLLGAATLARTAHPEAAPAKSAAKTRGIVNVIINREAGSSLKLTHQPPAPPYPAQARHSGLQGTVVAHLKVSPAGQVEVARVEGPAGLQDVAKAYAPGFRFEASERGGAATLTLIFELVPDPSAR